MSWGAPWNNTQDWSQPSWSSSTGHWASDHWQDSIWSQECKNNREGPASDKQQHPNLPHITTLGLKHPLPLDERKELLLDLIKQERPRDTVSFPRVGYLHYTSTWCGGRLARHGNLLRLVLARTQRARIQSSNNSRLLQIRHFALLAEHALALGGPEGELQTTGSHFDAADTKDAEGLSASEYQHPRTLDFTAQQVRQIHLCLASPHVFLALQLP